MADTPDPTDLPGTPEAETATPEPAPAPTPIAPAAPTPEDTSPPESDSDPGPPADDEPAPAEEPASDDDPSSDAVLPPPAPMDGDDDGDEEPPKKGGLSPMLLGGLGCGCLLVLIAGVVGIVSYMKWQEAEDAKNAKIAQAQQQMAQAWQKLQLYKTNQSANDDQPNLVVEANSLARSANTLHPTDDAMSVIALTQVWANRWHLMPTDQYNSSLWNQDEAYTKSALESSGKPAAYLARALILGYGCHLQGNPNPSNTNCAAAETAFSDAKNNMGGAPGWLRFELVWMEADYWNKFAWYAQGKRQKDSAKRYWARVRDVCNAPIESMASAPVNDEELIEACMVASGALADYEAWLSWSRMMRNDDIKDHRRTRSSTLKNIFRSAMPKCRSPRLKLRNIRGYKNFPRIDPYKNASHPFCAKAGLIALGCSYQAMEFDNWRYQTPQYSYNWQQLDRAARSYSSTHACYLNK